MFRRTVNSRPKRTFPFLKNILALASDWTSRLMTPSTVLPYGIKRHEVTFLFFLFSLLRTSRNDKRFFLKTQNKREIKFLLANLKIYMEHLRKYPHSLLVKFLGTQTHTCSSNNWDWFQFLLNFYLEDCFLPSFFSFIWDSPTLDMFKYTLWLWSHHGLIPFDLQKCV